jgi:hypothetical protein
MELLPDVLLYRRLHYTNLSRIARERARSDFTWRQCVDAYDMLYQRIYNGAVHGQSNQQLVI